MILLSLLGEQPIPNLLPLWHDRGYHATRFAATPATLPLAEMLAVVIQNDPQLSTINVLPPLLLDAYDIHKSRNVLSEALLECLLNEQQVCLNLTGGTKIMSLAALQAVYGSGIPLLYVSTEQNSLIYYQSDGRETSRQPIRVSISVNQYLHAHGLETSDNIAFKSVRFNDAMPARQGDALEEQVFQLARQSGFFDDVQRNRFIRRLHKNAASINELDIAVTCNGRLAVCSCKSGGNITNDDIYELDSLSRREAAGIYCGKVLVCKNEPPPGVRDRARVHGVRLVYGTEISSIAHVFKQALRLTS